MPSEPFFVDANVPMYAEGKEHPYKAACSRALERIANEDLPATTSAEVLQEVLHRYLSVAKGELARQMVDAVSTLVPDILPVSKEDVLVASRLSAEYPDLPSRDLVHLAVMLHHGIPAILSTDTHFDNVTQVRRIDPREF